MTNNLLVHINRKNDVYRDWKSTSKNDEYENKKKLISKLMIKLLPKK